MLRERKERPPLEIAVTARDAVATAERQHAAMPDWPGRRREAWAPAEFEALFTAHYAKLLRVARRLATDAAQAEELVGDAFWRLYCHRPRHQANLAGWLYRTLTRAGLDRARAAARRRKYERAAERSPGGPDPLDQALQAERARQVRAVLAALQPRDARVLLLRHGGASYEEIAAALRLRGSSIGTLLARAEKAFARQFRAMFETAGKTEEKP